MNERTITDPPKSLGSRTALAQLEGIVAVLYAISLPLSMTASYILLTIGMILWGAGLILEAVARRSDAERKEIAPLAIPLLILALALTISGICNGSPTYGEPGPDSLNSALKALSNFKSFLPYFWAYHVFCRDKKIAMLSVWLLLIVSAVAGIWGGIQQIFDIHPGFKYLQGTGFLGGPMAFAGQMQIFSLLALGLFFSGAYKTACLSVPDLTWLRTCLKPLQIPAVFFVIVLANFSGVLFAAERNVWLGVVFGILVMAGLHSWNLVIKALLSMSLLGAGLWALVPVVQIRINSLFSILSGGKDTSVDARLTIWQSCLDLFTQSPVFGTGIFRFPHFDIKGAIVPGVSSDLNHGHSNYFHILASTGLIGFSSFLVLFIWIFAYGIRQFKASRATDDAFRIGITQGLIAGVAAMMISGIFEYNFGTAQVRLAQWFLLGLL